VANGLVTMPGFFYKYYAVVQLSIYIILVFNNGAAYYIDYFSKKYELNLQELDTLEQSMMDSSANKKTSDDNIEK